MSGMHLLAGRLSVELTSADPAQDLRQIALLGIRADKIRMESDFSAILIIKLSDYRRIEDYANRKGLGLRIQNKYGIYWKLERLLHRPVLLIGVVLMFVLFCYLPTRILVVGVEGNRTIPESRILAAAKESGIGFWANRREVRSEKMKNALLAELPELQWAGVNTYGSRAVITVRERTEPEKKTPENAVSSIVALRDGVILSCTVTKGKGLCEPGQAVQKGQILISGYADCGISVVATRAEGEIYARTAREIRVITPEKAIIRENAECGIKKYSLQFGKNRINFYKGSGISHAGCVKMFTEYALTLPGGFVLPVKLIQEEIQTTRTIEISKEEEQVRDGLVRYGTMYLSGEMVAGTVDSRREECDLDDGCWILSGDYACTEMIGIRRAEQIGELP